MGMWEFWLDSSGRRNGLTADSFEHGSDEVGSVKGGKCIVIWATISFSKLFTERTDYCLWLILGVLLKLYYSSMLLYTFIKNLVRFKYSVSWKVIGYNNRKENTENDRIKKFTLYQTVILYKFKWKHTFNDTKWTKYGIPGTK